MLRYPERLHLAQAPTPLQCLERFHLPGKSSKICIKRDDLTGCATGGNKIRKLEFLLAEAQQQGADVIVTCGGVQSNHARATAVLGAQLGLKVHLLLRGEPEELTGEGNHLIDLLVGAHIDCYPSSVYVPQFQTLVDRCCDEYRQRGMKPYFITTGASDATGVWGYVRACEELAAQVTAADLHIDHIICATGSGGTLAGLIAGNALYGLGCEIHGINVCDNAAYFIRKVRQDLRDWSHKFSACLPSSLDIETLPIDIVDGYVGEGYGKASAPVYALIRQMAEQEGILLDPTYTGKAFHGLVTEISRGRLTGNILFVHTGGLFGLFADPVISRINSNS